MGLDTTHDGFHGAYSSFSRWRNKMAEVAGYPFEGSPDLPGREWPRLNWGAITDSNLQGEWESTPEDPLIVLIAHSDCEGVIHPEQAAPLADRLEQLLPLIPNEDDWGHIARDGGMVGVTRRFIDGLRAAFAAGEDLEFH